MAVRSKGASNWAWSGLGWPTGLGLLRPISAPAFALVSFHAIPSLCALACGSLTLFPSWLRLESLPSKLRCFLVESLKICTLTLRSSGHLESCLLRVLTHVGLHDLLPKCLMNLSRNLLFRVDSCINNKLQNRHARVNLLYSRG
jgi:hypothetical protein